MDLHRLDRLVNKSDGARGWAIPTSRNNQTTNVALPATEHSFDRASMSDTELIRSILAHQQLQQQQQQQQQQHIHQVPEPSQPTARSAVESHKVKNISTNTNTKTSADADTEITKK